MRTRTTFSLAAALPIMLLLQACPQGLSHPFAEQREAVADAGLVGTWRIADAGSTHEMEQVRVEQGEGGTYRITVLERNADYLLNDTVFPAWSVERNGRRVLVAFGAADSVFFHYGYELKDRQLTLYDLALDEQVKDPNTSAADIRMAIAASLEEPEGFVQPLVYTRQ